MAHTVAQCKEMIQVARKEKKLLAVGHQRHYNVLYENANDLIKKGLLGDIKFIRRPVASQQQLSRSRQLAKRLTVATRKALPASPRT